ncbi:MAG TPA: AMP-binding protein [bacterium]|nr:AMP-binding protein [bacterium]
MAEMKKFQRTVADQMEMKARDEKIKGKNFVCFQDEKITYQDFYKRSSLYAHLFQRLHREAGARENARVAVFMDNHPSFLYAFGGCALTAGTLFGVNTGLRGQVLADLMNQAKVQAVICDDRHYDRIHDVRGKLATVPPERTFVVSTGLDFAPPEDVRGIEETLAGLSEQMGDAAFTRPEVDVPMNTTLMIIYTSGTTGLPKGIKNSHGKLMNIGMASGMLLQLKPDDVGYACMPLFHSNSMFLAVMSAFNYNLPVVLRDKFSASGFAPDMMRYGVTYWNYVGQPVHYVILALERQYGSEAEIVKHVALDPRKRLRVAYGNGASPVDQDKFIRYFGLTDMMEAYGTTEMAIAVVRHIGDPRGSVGQILDGNVKIYSERGEECPAAEYDGEDRFLNYAEAVGEIVRLGGPLPAFEGYHDNPQEDSKKIRDGLYHSGDLGHIRVINHKRYLYFDGRTDDWIRKDGENFSAESVAQAVAGFPAVELAAAYGVPCPVSDEWVMAAVKLCEGKNFDPAEFHRYLREQGSKGDMDKKWMPEFVRVVPEFEYTRTQKILVRPLKHEYYNLEWVPEGTLYYYRRGFDTYRPFTTADMESLLAEFKTAGREQLLETWR